MSSIIKWRGIPTTQKRKHERKPRTIINRFGQKSLKLPRIDDKKRWAGYPGNTGISRKLLKHIPACLFYVEPFAGACKVFQALRMSHKNKVINCVLNDKSPFVYNWLKKEFSGVTITKTDFPNCFKIWDDKRTFFLIDPPWFLTYYKQSFSWFDRKSVKAYDIEVIKICRKLKGKFIITTRKENKIMLSSGFYNYVIKSEYPVSGKLPEVLLTTNFKLKGLKRILPAPIPCTYCKSTKTKQCNCGKAFCKKHNIDHLAECTIPLKKRIIKKC